MKAKRKRRMSRRRRELTYIAVMVVILSGTCRYMRSATETGWSV